MMRVAVEQVVGKQSAVSIQHSAEKAHRKGREGRNGDRGVSESRASCSLASSAAFGVKQSAVSIQHSAEETQRTGREGRSGVRGVDESRAFLLLRVLCGLGGQTFR